MPYYVYILASKPRGTLYTGVTNDLIRRIHEHKEGHAEGFTKKYDVKCLVYVETHEEIEHALRREKSIKRWTRSMKIEAIQRDNPEWHDLYNSLI